MPQVAFGVEATPARSKRASAGGCVNFIREQEGSSLVLYRRPGYSTVATFGDGASRGAIVAAGVAYIVVGGDLYSLDSDYTYTMRGSLQTTSGRVSMSWDGTYIVIVDGEFLYTYNVEGEAFARNKDTAIFSSPTHVVFSDGFHFINDAATGQVMTHSAAYDPAGDWNALDFATAEFSPDPLLSLVATHATLLLIGKSTTEPWEYDGNSLALPLAPIRAHYMEYGTAAKHSPINFDNGAAWLARDKNGQNVMIQTNGASITRISTNAEEAEWASYDTVSDAFSQVWWLEGHPLLIVTFPDADKTWVYDSSSPEGMRWSEWQRGDDNPTLRGRIRFEWSINLEGKTLCGDYEDGIVYEVDWDKHTDDGTLIHWSCRSPELKAEDESEQAHRQLKVFMEGGVGLTDEDDHGYNPKLYMRYTDDHGETWIEQTAREFGKKGNYSKRVFWNQLGSSRHRIYELYGSDPVTTVLTGGFIA